MLNEYLKEYQAEKKIKRHTLCYSLAGNKVEYFNVTAPSQPLPQKEKTDKKSIVTPSAKTPTKDKVETKVKKEVIMLTSRVHPGETGASWMMHGLMKTLLDP